MIRRISGIVLDAHPTHLVVDVAGIGYLVYTTIRTSCALGEAIQLYTHLAVRETALDLYGFTSQEELSFFELLLTLPKIGPKSAMQILSQADTSLLQQSIATEDPSHLSKMSGISKKTAEKIVLGLKGSFDDVLYTHENGVHTPQDAQHAFVSDAIDALIALGYPHADARKAVQQILQEKPEVLSANAAVKAALTLLG